MSDVTCYTFTAVQLGDATSDFLIDPTTHDKGGVLPLFSLVGDRVDDRLKLPNANVAVVDRTKVVEYLLNREHPDNGGKADFFIGLGFNPGVWDAFAAALRLLALSASVHAPWNLHTARSILLMD